MIPVFKRENGESVQVGVIHDPMIFIPKYVTRWMEAQEMQGTILPAGTYKLQFKVGWLKYPTNSASMQSFQDGFDSSKHNWFKFSGGVAPNSQLGTTHSCILYDLMLLKVS